MQYSAIIFTVLTLATSAFAAPAPTPAKRQLPTVTYGAGNHVIDASCPALPPPTEGPLPSLFPISSQLGTIIGPLLDLTIGADTVEDIDQAADQACVSAQQNNEGDGTCQLTFAAAREFVDAKTPLDSSKQFGCLLNLLCIADVGPEDTGTCNTLLAEADCIANRIVGADDVECLTDPATRK
ncbi:hypothetical protein MMC10_010429 [Thelotrema lepadinum]|nr:hypothetical protein [Thelotrema lepadinum]